MSDLANGPDYSVRPYANNMMNDSSPVSAADLKDVKRMANNVERKMWGVDIRYSISASMRLLDEIVANNKQRQDELEGQFQDVLETTTDEDYNSAPEIRAARNGKPNLKTRIDDFESETTAQLAHTAQEAGAARSNNVIIDPLKTNKFYLSLTDDDIKKEVWTKLKPVAEEFGVPMTLAVPVRNELTTPEEELTKEQLLHLQNELGWEMTSHSWTHSPQMRTFTDEELDFELGDSKRELESWGLNIKNFIAPFGVNDTASVRRIATKYYNSSYSAGGLYNLKPIKNHHINRMPFGSYTDKTDFNYYKTQIDNMITYGNESGGWLILMMHCAEASHDASQTEVLRQIIQYAQSLNIEIVNLQEGFEAMGNMFEVESETSLDHKGRLYGKQAHTFKASAGEIKVDTPPRYFYDNYYSSIVMSYHTYAENEPFPVQVGGSLVTYALGGSTDVSQEWRPINSNRLFIRKSLSATTWGPFEEIKVKKYDTTEWNFGQMSAYTSVEYPINSSALKPFDEKSVVTVNAVGGLAEGLVVQAWISDIETGIVTVRVTNVTNENVTAGTIKVGVTHI